MLDESNESSREMQITSSPYEESRVCALTGVEGAERVEEEEESS